MKRCFTLVLLLSVAFCNAQTTINNNVYLNANYNPALHTDAITPNRLSNLKGNIKILSAFEYSPNKDLSNGVQIQGTSNFTLLFDTGKHIIQEWSYWNTKQVTGKLFFRSYKSYTLDSMLAFDGNGKLASGEWYTYNSDGIKIKEKTLYSGATKQQSFSLGKAGDTVVHHNKLGIDKYVSKKLVEQNQQDAGLLTYYTYAPGGSIQRKTYYEKGRIVRIEDYNANGYLVFIQYNSFNNRGLVTSKDARAITYNQDGTAADETRVHITQAGTTREITSYVYQLGKLAQVKEGKPIVATYKYNDRGDVVEESNSDGKETYVYPLYDAKGNWLKKIHYHNAVPLDITERQIEYYP